MLYSSALETEDALEGITVKPSHQITSIKQSPVLKDHLFLVLSQKISYELNLF